MAGIKLDQKKPDMSLIPSAAEVEEARVWTAGKVKYSAYNWYSGINYSRILAAMQRHLTLLKAGIDMDDETKAHHAACIRCGSAMLITFTLEGRFSLDDRIQMTDDAKERLKRSIAGETMIDILESCKP
jgi:hypothetical protein